MPDKNLLHRKILIFTKFIFFTGVFLMAVLYWPESEVPYEIPKVHFFYYWVKTLAILGMVLVLLSIEKRNVNTKLISLVIAFVVASLISAIYGIDIEKSFVGNYYRADGLVTLFHLLGLFFFVVLFWEKSWRIPTSISVTIGVIVVSILSAIDGIRYYILENTSVSGWGGAIGSLFGQPNFLGGYLAVTLPFVIYLFSKQKKLWGRYLLIAAIGLQHIAILLTRSWGSLLVVFLFWFGYLFLEKKVKLKWLIVLGVVGVSLVFGGYYQHQKSEILVVEGRERIFRKVFLGYLDRPVTGYGWANVDYAFDSHDWPINIDNDVYVDKAHSLLLEILVTTGLVGSVSYLSIIFYVSYILFRRYKKTGGKPDVWTKTVLMVFVLYIVHSQTNIISISEEVLFWIVLGIIAVREH